MNDCLIVHCIGTTNGVVQVLRSLLNKQKVALHAEIAIKRNGVIYITAQNLSQKAICFPMQFDIWVVWVGLMGSNVRGISLWNAHHQYLFSIHWELFEFLFYFLILVVVVHYSFLYYLKQTYIVTLMHWYGNLIKSIPLIFYIVNRNYLQWDIMQMLVFFLSYMYLQYCTLISHWCIYMYFYFCWTIIKFVVWICVAFKMVP